MGKAQRILYISAKCSDLFSATLTELADGEKKSVKEYQGYVPEWLPNPTVEHFGDYVELKIDIETGQILNWKRPTEAQLKKDFK